MRSDATDNLNLRITYHGRVQGVGFRYTVNRIARKYPVTGYVRNLPEGTVELVISGNQDGVRQTLADVSHAFADNITQAEEAVQLSPTKFDDFSIRR